MRGTECLSIAAKNNALMHYYIKTKIKLYAKEGYPV